MASAGLNFELDRGEDGVGFGFCVDSVDGNDGDGDLSLCEGAFIYLGHQSEQGKGMKSFTGSGSSEKERT